MDPYPVLLAKLKPLKITWMVSIPLQHILRPLTSARMDRVSGFCRIQRIWSGIKTVLRPCYGFMVSPAPARVPLCKSISTPYIAVSDLDFFAIGSLLYRCLCVRFAFYANL